MSPTDRTPLLENGHGADGLVHRPSYKERIVNLFTVPDDQPGWIRSFMFFFFGSWMNVMLVFVPLSFISHHLDWDAALRFSFSFIAIIPLAKVTSRVF
jgi:Ca2+:H+ antiporter